MDLRGPHCPMLADILSQNLVFEPEMEFHYAIDLGQNSCVNSPQFLAGSKCVQKIHNYSNTYCSEIHNFRNVSVAIPEVKLCFSSS